MFKQQFKKMVLFEKTSWQAQAPHGHWAFFTIQINHICYNFGVKDLLKPILPRATYITKYLKSKAKGLKLKICTCEQ